MYAVLSVVSPGQVTSSSGRGTRQSLIPSCVRSSQYLNACLLVSVIVERVFVQVRHVFWSSSELCPTATVPLPGVQVGVVPADPPVALEPDVPALFEPPAPPAPATPLVPPALAPAAAGCPPFEELPPIAALPLALPEPAAGVPA